jgi:hypothetical protein
MINIIGNIKILSWKHDDVIMLHDNVIVSSYYRGKQVFNFFLNYTLSLVKITLLHQLGLIQTNFWAGTALINCYDYCKSTYCTSWD